MSDPPLRLESLDVFRGLTIAGMILVSTPGTWNAVYWPLEHADWNGWTPTDLVFPFLLFAMGAAVPFALARRRGKQPVHLHVVRRAAILFALGLVLNTIETAPPIDLGTFRIMGVLQRIALVYLAVAWLTENTTRRTQIAVAVAALAGYWAALALVPVPAPDTLPGLIDKTILGRHTLTTWGDPEGFLSTIPSIATALAGVFAGDWLKQPRQPHRSLWLWVAGVAATAIGLAWGLVFPINKNLWTSSFALFSAGMAAQTLALCHWLLDVRGWRAWAAPFAALGRNPLAAYFLSVGVDALLGRWTVDSGASLKTVVYRAVFASWLRPCCGAETASLAYALVYVALWALVAMEMRRRRIFIGI
jgi:predicted acyltransferase